MTLLGFNDLKAWQDASQPRGGIRPGGEAYFVTPSSRRPGVHVPSAFAEASADRGINHACGVALPMAIHPP